MLIVAILYYDECLYAECRYAECHGAYSAPLTVTKIKCVITLVPATSQFRLKVTFEQKRKVLEEICPFLEEEDL